MKKLLFFGLLLAIAIIFSTATFSQVYPEGMIAYWKFDKGVGLIAYDSVNGNHGDIYGATWTTGIVGGALSFDGNDVVKIPYSDDWNTGDELTVEAWVNLNSHTYWGAIVSRDGYWCWPSPWYNGWVLELYAFWDTILFRNTVLADPIELYNSPMYDINYGQWYHAVGVYDGSYTRLYINGQEIGTGTPSSGLVNPSNEYGITIGSDTGCWGFYVKGLIDEVAIYNKALTPEEIQHHYQNGLNGLGYDEMLEVPFDIKPGSCPNPFNVKSKGVLSVAVLGTEDFDVFDIDPDTILLTREGYEDYGVLPIRWSYEDVATPFKGELWDCHDINGDGYLDLSLKFKTQELVEFLELDLEEIEGETIALIFTGNLNEEEGGTSITGSDCIKVLKTGKKK